MTPIHYEISIAEPHTHVVDVKMRLRVDTADPQVALPSWTPGSYLMREFGRHILTMTATADGAPTEAFQEGKAQWSLVSEAGAEIEVSYSVYAHDLTVRTAHVDGSHAFLMGTSLYLFVVGELHRPVTLEVSAPKDWETFTTLPTEEGSGRFCAEDYDELVDCPLELGSSHEQLTFEVRGVTHHVVLWGRSNADQTRLAKDMAAVVEANAVLFDGLPYERYLFIIHVTEKGMGGLEHRDSCALVWQPHGFVGDDYRDFLRLVAHEHFHVWNVKRIRPAALGPFDYLNETQTRALWAMEGVTSHFDKRQVLRAGLINSEQYLKWVAESIDRLDAVPGHFRASLEQASFDAWIKLYRPGENTPNASVSYYLLGSLVTLALDIEIRKATEGEKSFDDVLGLLWGEFLETGAGVADERFQQVIVEVGGETLEPWCRKYISEPAQIDWPHHLDWLGLAMERGAPEEGPDFGVLWSAAHRMTVATVLDTGPNRGADLYPGDQVIAINGFEVDKQSWDAVSRLLPRKGEVEIALFRRRTLRTVSARVQPKQGKWSIVPRDDATVEQRDRRSVWLFENLLAD